MIKNLIGTETGRSGTVYSKLFDKEIEIFLPDDDVTVEYAERCAEAFNNLPVETVENICKASKAYCLWFMEMVDFDTDELTVRITPETPPMEIMKCFSPSVLVIDSPDDESRTGYQLECNCDWEIEHGMEIDILDGKLVYLSMFNGYSPWLEYDDDDLNFANAVK